MGPSSSAPAGLGAQPQNTSSVAAATVPIPAAPVVPTAPVVPAAPVSSTPAATVLSSLLPWVDFSSIMNAFCNWS